MYLWQGNKDTLYRIHGTIEPWTIGRSVSSGCIRMINQDVIDLYQRTPVGGAVIALTEKILLASQVPSSVRRDGYLPSPSTPEETDRELVGGCAAIGRCRKLARNVRSLHPSSW
jgi:hypothetical protein